MKYFILMPVEGIKGMNDNYSIIKVKDADLANFKEDYGQRILVEASSMLDAFVQFEALKRSHH